MRSLSEHQICAEVLKLKDVSPNWEIENVYSSTYQPTTSDQERE